MNIASVAPERLKELLRQGASVQIIDVRTPAEFREIHVDGARNVPLDQLDPTTLQSDHSSAAASPLYVVCRSGGRGQKACEKLAKAGIANVINIEGGTLACVAAGLPVVRGKKTISLERQVRISAGLLVLLGTAMGWWVHPSFYGLAAFIGAGLIFAGITDTCGIGMVLARMPWNQVKKSCMAG